MGDIKEHVPANSGSEVGPFERREVIDKDITGIERVMSPEMEKNFMNYDKVDAEIAKCTCLQFSYKFPNVDAKVVKMLHRPVSKSLKRRVRGSNA
jgi:hypothetical protein